MKAKWMVRLGLALSRFIKGCGLDDLVSCGCGPLVSFPVES